MPSYDAYLEACRARHFDGPVYAEDLLGERIFIPEWDAFGTIEYSELVEDWDEDGGHTEVFVSVKIDGQKYEQTYKEFGVQAWYDEQRGTPIQQYDPKGKMNS